MHHITRSGASLAEQWTLDPSRSTAERHLAGTLVRYVEDLKRELAQLAIDVLVDAPVRRRRATCGLIQQSAVHLTRAVSDLTSSGLWTASGAAADLGELCDQAARAGKSAAPTDDCLVSLGRCYRLLRTVLLPLAGVGMVEGGYLVRPGSVK